MAKWIRVAAPVLIVAALLFQATAQTRGAAPPVYGYQVVRSYPHDKTAFTQGLLYLDGFLYESTGLEGRSTVRKVELETGRVVQEFRLTPEYFGEGLTNWRTELLQLTWKHSTGFVYDRATLRVLRSFTYSGEGWGLANDGAKLLLSDGTSTIRFLDPQTFREIGRVTVRDRGKPVTQVNELEYIRGEIYANIWQTDRVARISPRTGDVVGWLDLKGLVTAAEANPAGGAVLNGIAYDASKDRLFVTGKLWPKLFEIKIGARK